MLKTNIKKRVQRLVITGLALVFLSGIFPGAIQGLKHFAEPLKQGSGLVQVAHAEPPEKSEQPEVTLSDLDSNGQSIQPEEPVAPPPAESTAPKVPDKPKSPAASAAPKDPVKDATEDVVANLVSVISLILSALGKVLWPLILVMGGLMDNSLLFGWGMEERLLEIWQQIRNIVNVIFVIMLLGIALVNIIGVGGENYYLKTILPKFIIGLIAVNFSFLGMKVVLDGLNVATASIFSLPSTLQVSPVPKDEDAAQTDFYTNVCKGICGPEGDGCESFENEADMEKKQTENGYVPLCYTFKDGSNCKNITLAAGSKASVNPSKSLKHCPSQKLVNTFIHFNGQNASVILAVRMMNMANLDQLKGVPDLLAQKGGWEKLTISIIFSLIMYIIYGTGFVVLFIVLIVRLAVLWLAIALSPVIVLKYVFPQLLEKFGGGELETKIVSTAIAPLTIAFTMSVGFIMMDKFSAITGENMKIVFGDVNLSQQGKMVNSVMNLNLGTPAIATVQQLFMAAATIAFVWMGIVAASSKTVAEKLTGAITGAVGQAGAWLSFAPFKYTGIIPVTNQKTGQQDYASLGTMLKAIKSVPNAMEEEERKKMTELFPMLGAGGGADDLARDIGNVNSKESMEKLLAQPWTSTHITDPAVAKALHAKQNHLSGTAGERIKKSLDANGVKPGQESELMAAHREYQRVYAPTPAAGAAAGAEGGAAAQPGGGGDLKSDIGKIREGGKITAAIGKLDNDLKKAKTDAEVQAVMGKDEHQEAIAQMKILQKTTLADGDIDAGKPNEQKVQARYDAYVAVTGDAGAAKRLAEKDIDQATLGLGSGAAAGNRREEARKGAKAVLGTSKKKPAEPPVPPEEPTPAP